MDSHKFPSPHPQVAARIIDGYAVIVLADSGQVNVLNAVGTRIWQLMDGTRSLREIADVIGAEYDVAPRGAQADVQDFARQLADAQIIIFQEQPTLG